VVESFHPWDIVAEQNHVVEMSDSAKHCSSFLKTARRVHLPAVQIVRDARAEHWAYR
jgi:hypothetical protein